MCGIVVANKSIDSAMKLIAHRGVRQTIREVGRGVWLGHVRLPIVGLDERYDQPTEAGGWTIAFVGELLDYKDHVPGAESDLPLVAKTWVHDGAAGFRKFDGFWSVVAVDRRGTIHVVVDYLAQKPMYYRTRGAVGAASELDAIASLGPVTPDEIYFSAIVKWGYCPETWRTPYREVRRVLPGHYVELSPQYWTATDHGCIDALQPAAATPGELKSEIELSVRRRVLSSDVPVAALVSGGLDSAIVYALAKRYGDVHAYFADSGDAAEQLAASAVIGSGRVTKADWDDVPLEWALARMQEPLDLGSLLPQCALANAIGTSGGERVCLTGDAADELFGGYGRAMRYDSQYSDIFHELVGWHLPRLDRIMMRNRVEIRSPFLARRVVEMALGLPRDLRTNKKILRDLFMEDLPPGVADRPKVPLRTKAVEHGREANSKMLVDAFRRAKWP